MYVLTKVNELPPKNCGTKGRANGAVYNAIYEFLAGDYEYARIDDICHRHANGNNLRKDFSNMIKFEKLDDVVEATIRGNTVYLRRLK